jgi:hypothetical protein
LAAQTALADSPTITGFSPASGPPNWLVTITGSGFTTAADVLFTPTNTSYWPTDALFAVQDDNTIVATVPFIDTVPLATTIAVENGDGSGSAATEFSEDGQVTLSEARGSSGESVTLTGSNFTAATTVSFGGWPTQTDGEFVLSNPKLAHFRVLSDTKITATVPSLVAGRRCCIEVVSPTATGVSDRSAPFLVIRPRLLRDDYKAFAVRPAAIIPTTDGSMDIGRQGGHIRWRRWGTVAYGIGTVRVIAGAWGPLRAHRGSVTAFRLRGGRYTRMSVRWSVNGKTRAWRMKLEHQSSPESWWFWQRF